MEVVRHAGEGAGQAGDGVQFGVDCPGNVVVKNFGDIKFFAMMRFVRSPILNLSFHFEENILKKIQF